MFTFTTNNTANIMTNNPSPSALESYAKTCEGLEHDFALVAAKWIAACPTASHDPLLSTLWKRAQQRKRSYADKENKEISELPDFISSFPTSRRSILDYLGSSTTAATTAATATAAATTITAANPVYHIYTDGACTANGRKAAKAGWAMSVWLNGREVDAAYSALGPTEPHTNQRAELKGLQAALQKATALVSTGEATCEIHTDSKYAMDCLQTWGTGWAAKGWRKADGAPVLHQDLIKPMWVLWKARGPYIRLFHVSAHTGKSDLHSRGNARADELAVQAAAAVSR